MALARAVAVGDGWIGMNSTPGELEEKVARLGALASAAGRRQPLEVTIGGRARSPEDLARWRDAGCSRLLVGDLGRSSEAVATLERRAGELGLVP